MHKMAFQKQDVELRHHHIRHATHHLLQTTSTATTVQVDYTDNETTLLYYLVQSNETVFNATDRNSTSVGDDLYLYSIPPMVLFCIISIAINIKILASVYWIRRPMTPTLHISLSLAAADAYASTVFGTGLVINSWLPKGFNIILFESHAVCFQLTLEALRMAGLIITVAHLMALAINHYLGILKPLHYASIMTHRNTTILTIFLWVVPIIFIMIYFLMFEDDGFQNQKCTYNFMLKLKFRAVISSLFFGPLIIMVLIYTHIFVIVKRHQASRLRFSRTGSVHLRTYSTHNGRHGSSRSQQEQQMQRNVKAIHTTLLILGSYIIGLMPGVVVFALICSDCRYKFEDFNGKVLFYVYMIVNTLLILKTLVNPIIYAARMNEIRNASRRMHAHLCSSRCYNNTDTNGHEMCTHSSTASHNRLSVYGSTRCGLRGRSTRHTTSILTNGSVRGRTDIDYNTEL